MIQIYLQGDAHKCSHWTTLLVIKMKESCDFEFITKKDYVNDEVAMMNVTDPTFQPRPKVILGHEWSREDNVNGVMALMHELGHVVDYKAYKCSLSYYWRQLGTLEMEVRAWENAFRLARQVGFHDFQLLHDFSLKCLETYFSPFSSARGKDKHFGFKGQRIHFEEAKQRMSIAQKDAERAVKESLYRV